MRSFYISLLKNLTWIYFIVICCFSYHLIMKSIPDHMYVIQGEEVSLECMLPVELEVMEPDVDVMQELSQTTYEVIVQRRSAESSGGLTLGQHEAVCYLFGMLPVKEVSLSVVEEQKLYAAGHVVGIYGATQGVLVLGSSPVETVEKQRVEPAENLLFPGDYIVEVNGERVQRKEELADMIREATEDTLVISLLRNNELIQVAVHPVEVVLENGTKVHQLGIWVKDDMAGIGTLTYYDSSASFGALGHGIGDGKTGELLCMNRGELYEAEVMDVKKGKRGNPGELQGVVYYGNQNRIGVVDSNSSIGIYGTLAETYFEAYKNTDEVYPVGYKQEVTNSDAVILSDVSGEIGVYHVVIDSLDYTTKNCNKGIRFHVDDPVLLQLTGGIVQGLSGSPIIQGGKIIGAVTHVLVNDPTRGYGIFIENMLEH